MREIGYVLTCVHPVPKSGASGLTHFYSRTNQMHNISNLFYFGTTLYILRFGRPYIVV